MKKLRCPACKEPLQVPTEPEPGSSFICAFCGEVAIFRDDRMRAMTVKEFLNCEASSQGRIRRAVAKVSKE